MTRLDLASIEPLWPVSNHQPHGKLWYPHDHGVSGVFVFKNIMVPTIMESGVFVFSTILWYPPSRSEWGICFFNNIMVPTIAEWGGISEGKNGGRTHV